MRTVVESKYCNFSLSYLFCLRRTGGHIRLSIILGLLYSTYAVITARIYASRSPCLFSSDVRVLELLDSPFRNLPLVIETPFPLPLPLLVQRLA